MKAGGAYVPMDPTYPQDRIDFIIEDTAAELVLTQQHLVENGQVILSQDKTVLVDLTQEFYNNTPTENLDQHSQSTDLAYVIYTSGTTGKPKGVMQLHANVMRLFTSTAHQFEFNADDVWTMFHAYTFDFSVWELWGPLTFGGKLIVIPKEITKDIEGFYNLCREEKVTVLNQTPSAFYEFADVANQSTQENLNLRFVVFGGEALNVFQLNAWWNYQDNNQLNTRLINMYGITETTVHVTFKEISQNETVQSNIGKPLADLKSYVLSPSNSPVPIGVIGELYIGGAGLARGYLNLPELTAERFIDNPFATKEDKEKGYTRLYKTGDLVRWMPDGNLEYIGRNDDQVKIRGYRIELGDIENTVLQIDGIKQASVIAKERKTASGTT
jgi:amino acid adenylation domain-containing protein